jgi:hypothetical protein
VLGEVQLGAIVRTPQLQRWRLLVLTAGMWVLLRLPRVESLAQVLFRRWHVKKPPAKTKRRSVPARSSLDPLRS